MSIETLFLFSGLSFQALSDLRWRTAPAASMFCLAGVLLGFSQDPKRVLVALLILLWGLGLGTTWAAYLFLLHPTSLLLIPWGYAVRTAQAGLPDLLILVGIGAALPWPVLLLAALGIEVWRHWWRWRYPSAKRMPMIPGVAFGYGVYLLVVLS